ncbi:hypothetical protein QBC43DRAFT_312461 [Cladorrhinum sp. PSN259]|nr:hypothetical protein QBC43DRAFT_312461 [Cladorrhinum sp. PSN259]
MSSIGPQLPPHLQKRKRTPEEDGEQPSSPPAKVTRRGNEDEIALDDSDSDDGFGPSAPAAPIECASIGPSLPPQRPPSVAKPSIGPSLPPTSTTKNQDEIPLSDSESDDTGPASAPPPKRVLGPASPPAPLSERPTTSPNSDSDSEDDDWGPALPGSTPISRPSGPSLPTTSTSIPQAPKRDDWMMAPPTSSGYKAPDPTKLKSRKFASGPRASTDVKQPGAISSIWTETPEEKVRRLANAVLGREDPNNNNPGTSSASTTGSGKKSKRSEEEEARIRKFTEQTRGKSLVEEHQTRKAEARAAAAAARNKESSKYGKQAGAGADGDDDEDDDPSKRAFSWEKDMKIGGSVSGSQTRQLLSKAASFSGRFEKGKYL